MAYEKTHLPNLGQLKAALQRSHGEVSELAAIVLGTLEDMIIQENFSIPTSAWSANSDEAVMLEGYMYKAVINIPRLIENANVNITLSVPSLAVAQAAHVSATAVVAEGALTFYAKSIPTAALTGKLDAIQLSEDVT